MQWLPNLLTGLRVVLTPVIFLQVLSGNCYPAFWLSMIAGFTDTADGYFARKLNTTSRLGAWLDPVADKLLLTSLFIVFGIAGMVPPWLVWLVVGRDIMISLLVAGGVLLLARWDFPPSIWGKLSTVIQISATLILLAACADIPYARKLVEPAIVLTTVGTAWSGLHYLCRAVLMMKAAQHKV